MNTLELRSELHTFATDDNLYLVCAIFVDGESVADFRSYATSLSELKRSTGCSGTYSIVTCWCGAPECAAIYQGVQVTHGQGTVEWIISQPEPQRVFRFGLEDYERAVAVGIEQIGRDLTALTSTAAGEQDEKLQLVPGWDEDVALIKPEARAKAARRHRNV